jgi:hypothetical protein
MLRNVKTGHWNLSKSGISSTDWKMVRRDDFKCKTLHEGKLTDYIKIKNGARQGSILSWIIFLLLLDNVMGKTLGTGRGEYTGGWKIG